MTDSEANWFYTVAGQQQGPVTLAELKAKAKDDTLNPRHDMVWKEGMADWQPAGEVAEIFERRAAVETSAAAPATSGAPATAASAVNTDPYAPPATAGTDADLLQQGVWPGARRRTYLAVTVVVPILALFGTALIVPLMNQGANAETLGIAVFMAMFVMTVTIIYFGVQRLANVGMSRWWYLGNLVPILNLWIGYRMFACPAGYAYHKKLDGAGIALAIIYWLMILLSVALVIFSAILQGSPEFQQQIENIIRSNEASSQ